MIMGMNFTNSNAFSCFASLSDELLLVLQAAANVRSEKTKPLALRNGDKVTR